MVEIEVSVAQSALNAGMIRIAIPAENLRGHCAHAPAG
jgi:hypothetical protein